MRLPLTLQGHIPTLSRHCQPVGAPAALGWRPWQALLQVLAAIWCSSNVVSKALQPTQQPSR